MVSPKDISIACGCSCNEARLRGDDMALYWRVVIFASDYMRIDCWELALQPVAFMVLLTRITKPNQLTSRWLTPISQSKVLRAFFSL